MYLTRQKVAGNGPQLKMRTSSSAPVVTREDLCTKGCCLESHRRSLEIHFWHIELDVKMDCLFEKTEDKRKRGWGRPVKKICGHREVQVRS